jgi:4-carboxymuconolactone decarboxylase
MQLASEDRVTSLDPVFGSMGVEAGRAIWGLRELTMREKAVLFLAADVSVPQFGLPFELHLAMALKQADMPVEDLRELFRHIAPDAGYGITATAFQRLVEIAKALGLDPRSSGTRTEHAPDSGYSDATLAALRELDPDFGAYVEDQARKLWPRRGLTRRERSFASLAVDVIAGTLGSPFRSHLALAADAGISGKDLRAAMKVLAEFSIPKVWEALIVLRQFEGETSEHLPPTDTSNPRGRPMTRARNENHTTTQSDVAVTKYLRDELSPADSSGLAIVETRLEEQFTGGLEGTGWATHLRLFRPDGTQTLMCIERFSGKLDGRAGSFVLEATGFSDALGFVHGRWKVVEGSGTDELFNLRGYATFVAKPDKSSKSGWSAQTTLTYWFGDAEEPAAHNG